MRHGLAAVAVCIVMLACAPAGADGVSAVDSAAPDPAVETAPLHRVGQAIIAGFRGDRPKHPRFERFLQSVSRNGIGGALFLARNIGDRASTRAMIERIVAASPAPSFITIDQEGGRVQRITDSRDFPDVPAAAGMPGSLTPWEAQQVYGQLARALRDWGFNTNFGPVVDLATNPDNPIIAGLNRAYSAHGPVVTAYAAAFVDAHRAEKIVTVLKHFPGHGSSLADSHVEPVDISRTWRPSELDPYRSLIGSGRADAIMVGHLVLDRSPDFLYGALPASLSAPLINGLLQRELGNDGPIVADDLRMKALDPVGSVEDRIVASVLAGADLVIVSSKRSDPSDFLDRLVDRVAQRAGTNPAFDAALRRAGRRSGSLRQSIGQTKQPE